MFFYSEKERFWTSCNRYKSNEKDEKREGRTKLKGRKIKRTSRSLTLPESWDPGDTRSGSKKQDGNGTWNGDDDNDVGGGGGDGGGDGGGGADGPRWWR